ncbi:MAG: hypothetical protein LBK73_01425 [Treponema sp.]|jgi:putative aldouronate transport system substrate-binding protein|nr:hypothetical protein [Treponema sp.]
MYEKNQSPCYGNSALRVQKEVLKDAGYPKIVTMDEYFDLLVNCAKKYPTINGASAIPFAILADDWHAFCLWNPPNFIAGYPNEDNGTVDPVVHEYKTFSRGIFPKGGSRNSTRLTRRAILTLVFCG